ncbi:MAG: hypothetical protein ABSB80_05720 [Methanoregula sp.]|jgi:hypothetical protein|uniref:hypothetical protein n=1 Tax=Methanoregula sp. TaxID=2052170 RepID=UPI003D13D245
MKHLGTVTVSVIIACILISGIPVSADNSGTLTRGGSFSVKFTGLPNTQYYFWLTRTFTMSGEPGDQPPIVMANQANIQQDPAGGPYTIGSYAYSNGGGRTILDDVAPSSQSMSNTNYYGLVTTDSSGQAIVTFLTSSATATRSFSVRAENPTSTAGVNLQETVFSRTTPPTPVIITPTMTQTTLVPPSPTPATPVITVQPTTIPPSTRATTRSAPLESGLVALATGAGLLAAIKRS